MTTPTLPPTPSTIANLPLATTPLSGNEFVPISQNGVTKAVAANGFSVVGPQGPAGPAGVGNGAVNSGTIHDLAYYAATGTTVSGLATANSGILVTSASGVPSIATSIPNGVTATTQSALDDSTKVATTQYVDSAVAAIPPATQNYTLISSQTISSSTATVSVTTGINSTYSHYVWEIRNLLSVTNNVDGYVTLQQGGVFVASGYYDGAFYSSGGSLTAFAQSNTNYFNVTCGLGGIYNSGPPSIIRIHFWQPATASPLSVIWDGMQANSVNGALIGGGGFLNTSAATTGIKLALSSGNIATCIANLYGIT